MAGHLRIAFSQRSILSSTSEVCLIRTVYAVLNASETVSVSEKKMKKFSADSGKLSDWEAPISCFSTCQTRIVCTDFGAEKTRHISEARGSFK